jgi:serine/threonine-protein kinase
MFDLRIDATMPGDAPRRAPARFGDYRVVAPLAQGGMAGVYLAAHQVSGEQVALKVLDPRFIDHPEVVRRLCAERDVSALTRHPGLVQIRAAARSSDGVPYLVMEYLRGRTLVEVMEEGPLDCATIAALGAQVAAALAELHRVGVVHCDVKPENLVVLDDAAGLRIKVIDFGVARQIDEPPPDDAALAGTPAFMAPEQWRGRPGAASDVYALGCVVYALLTGEPPFAGSLPEIMMCHLEQRPARPSWLRAGVPIDLERLVLRMLAKDPDLRPTMAEAAEALAAIAAATAAADVARVERAVIAALAA